MREAGREKEVRVWFEDDGRGGGTKLTHFEGFAIMCFTRERKIRTGPLSPSPPLPGREGKRRKERRRDFSAPSLSPSLPLFEGKGQEIGTSKRFRETLCNRTDNVEK